MPRYHIHLIAAINAKDKQEAIDTAERLCMFGTVNMRAWDKDTGTPQWVDFSSDPPTVTEDTFRQEEEN